MTCVHYYKFLMAIDSIQDSLFVLFALLNAPVFACVYYLKKKISLIRSCCVIWFISGLGTIICNIFLELCTIVIYKLICVQSSAQVSSHFCNGHFRHRTGSPPTPSPDTPLPPSFLPTTQPFLHFIDFFVFPIIWAYCISANASP